MIESIESLRAAASAQGTKRLAVACAQDDHVLLAVDKARRLGISEAILVGCEQQIRRIAAEHALDLTPYRIIDEPDNAALLSSPAASENEAEDISSDDQ